MDGAKRVASLAKIGVKIVKGVSWWIVKFPRLLNVSYHKVFAEIGCKAIGGGVVRCHAQQARDAVFRMHERPNTRLVLSSNRDV